jgi:hypothetical protein
MHAVRHLAPFALSAIVLVAGVSGCGGSSHATVTASVPAATTTGVRTHLAPSFATARARTTSAGPVDFTLAIKADVGGGTVTAGETGVAAFVGRRAHLYKQIPGSTVPEELVLIGPLTYTNANVMAALADPTVKPWTKLDTRRLTAKARRTQPDELAHVLAPAYLADGVAVATPAGRAANGTTRFTGVVDPARLARRVPAAVRPAILTAIRNDYAAKPFPATFWLDDQGRIRRVRVAYKTPQGSRITVDTSYTRFGAKVDVALPAAGDIKDITP